MEWCAVEGGSHNPPIQFFHWRLISWSRKAITPPTQPSNAAQAERPAFDWLSCWLAAQRGCLVRRLFNQSIHSFPLLYWFHQLPQRKEIQVDWFSLRSLWIALLNWNWWIGWAGLLLWAEPLAALPAHNPPKSNSPNPSHPTQRGSSIEFNLISLIQSNFFKLRSRRHCPSALPFLQSIPSILKERNWRRKESWMGCRCYIGPCSSRLTQRNVNWFH